MRYTEIVVYRRLTGTEHIQAFRVTEAHGHLLAKELPIADMYRGHCAWIAEQITPPIRRVT